MKMGDINDKTGFALGAERLKVASEGKVAEIAYKWPRPGTEDRSTKASFVTKLGDQVCGVGYDK